MEPPALPDYTTTMLKALPDPKTPLRDGGFMVTGEFWGTVDCTPLRLGQDSLSGTNGFSDKSTAADNTESQLVAGRIHQLIHDARLLLMATSPRNYYQSGITKSI